MSNTAQRAKMRERATSEGVPVLGTRPVATMHASTSKVSLCSLVLASIILMVTGLTPGMPGVTSEAKTPNRESMARGLIKRRSANRRISGSKVGMRLSIASIKVTSEPSACQRESTNEMQMSGDSHDMGVDHLPCTRRKTPNRCIPSQ